VIYHIAVATDWEDAQTSGEYRISTRGVRLEDVGFIHASFEHQVERVGALLYANASVALVVLVIDPKRVRSPLKLEGVDGGAEEFPHIYGPLPTSAVVDVLPVVVQEGQFIVDRLVPDA
jgi:glutathione S-transferase